MSGKRECFGVIWHDFVPLALPCASASEATGKRDEMKARASAAGLDVAAMDIRAVRVPAGLDVLELLP